MKQHINPTTKQQHRCYACGQSHAMTAMRPFGRHAGHVLTWVCGGCSLPTPIELAPSPRLMVTV